MTSYEQGFLTKCAEHGVPDQMAMRMLRSRTPGMRKSAQFMVNPYMAGGVGALAGGGIGLLIEAMRKKKKDEKSHYLRNFLIGAGILGAGGAGAAMTNNAIARRDFALADLAGQYSSLQGDNDALKQKNKELTMKLHPNGQTAREAKRKADTAAAVARANTEAKVSTPSVEETEVDPETGIVNGPMYGAGGTRESSGRY